MGAGQNAMLGLVGAAGVTASKLAGTAGKYAFASENQNSDVPISKANDGGLALKMAEKARKNTMNQIQSIMNNQNISKQARSRRLGKALKDFQGGDR